MKAYVIAIEQWPVSRKYGQRAVASLRQHGLDAEIFSAVTPDTVEAAETRFGVRARTRYQTTQMKDPRLTLFKRSCFMSHFSLWNRCFDSGRPIVVAEHDTVMTRNWDNPEFSGDILNLNVLRTRAGSVPDDHYAPPGIHAHPGDFNRAVIDRINGRDIEAGRINGAHFYVIKPSGAEKLIRIAREDGFINTDNMINERYTDLEYVSPVYGRIQGNLYSSEGWNAGHYFAFTKLMRIRIWKLVRNLPGFGKAQ